MLASDVASRHSPVGWIQLARTQYQRYIDNHRARHFEAVIESLVALAERDEVERIVLAGEPKHVAQFRQMLPPRIARLVAGVVSGTRDEAGGDIARRASELVRHLESQEQAIVLDDVLTEAAKGGRAVSSLEATVEAVNRGAVRRLYVFRTLSHTGSRCVQCQWLQPTVETTCPLCGAVAKPDELTDAMVGRVIASGGEVEIVDLHEQLRRAGGVAALLHYPL